MQTRSQTKLLTPLITMNLKPITEIKAREKKEKNKQEIELDIDFDEASRAWKKNKIYIGNGMYKYKK